jgi:hypothetical protein
MMKGVPVVDTLSKALHTQVNAAKGDGTWLKLLDKHKPKKTICSAQSNSGIEASQVKMKDFFGPTSISFAMAILVYVTSLALGTRGRAVKAVHVAGSHSGEGMGDPEGAGGKKLAVALRTALTSKSLVARAASAEADPASALPRQKSNMLQVVQLACAESSSADWPSTLPGESAGPSSSTKAAKLPTDGGLTRC